MDPQHLARLDDDGQVGSNRIGPFGGLLAAASPEGPEVPVPAPVHPLELSPARRVRRARSLFRRTPIGGATIVLRPDGLSDAWPLPVEDDVASLTEPWPLLDVDAVQLAGAQPAPAEEGTPAGPSTAEEETAAAVVAAIAAGRGPRHRRPAARNRRPARYLAAAVIGVAGIGIATTASDTTATAQADEPVSVAEELGMVQGDQTTVSGTQAADQLRTIAASRAEREDAEAAAAQVQAEADQAAAAAAAEAARPKAVLPVQGARISSTFGYRWGTLHAGVDFAAALGTPEYAAMDGVVIRAGAASGFGLAVYIQHANGDVTVYGHMEEILVEEGQTVKAGDTIALLGNEGESTGPHLHFEVHQGGIDGEKVDPLPWLRANGVDV